jgi:hypothetical protein
VDSTNSQNGLTLLQEEDSWRNEFLKSNLQTAILNVAFIKKDGTQRQMRCTLRADLLPSQTDLEEALQKKTPNPDVLAVWDLEADGWRSFRYDSILGFSIPSSES